MPRSLQRKDILGRAKAWRCESKNLGGMEGSSRRSTYDCLPRPCVPSLGVWTLSQGQWGAVEWGTFRQRGDIVTLVISTDRAGCSVEDLRQ